MLQIQNLHYAIADRQLLSDICWIIQPGKRVALIGPNGAGKTTLLRIINGEIQHHHGTILKPKRYRIGYLPQEETAIGRGSILEIALEGQKEILELEKRITELRLLLDGNTTPNEETLNKLGNLEHQYEILGGYTIEFTARKILAGLGFSEQDFRVDLNEFSGGWRMRVFLARLLLQNPDLLLLDEPTNHLDLPSLEWLESYLLNFAGSIVIVSHDRYFIDRLAQEIYELDHGKLEHYAGNYHFFEVEKQKRIELLYKKWEEQQAVRERQERFINRFRYKATKAVQVQSRIKQLEKLEQIELPAPPPRRPAFQISVDAHSYKHVLKIEDMSFRYDKDWVLQQLHLNIYRGEKISLVGVNGAGKTTLTKIIAGQLTAQEGTVQLGKRCMIGYYAQHQIDALNLEATVYDEVASTVASSHAPKIRDVLGIFQLSGDEVFKKIGVLSGGEKARVSLAKILLSPVNFLIMDEPTNHLDVASKEALEKALAQYDGTLLLISHDRYFLDKLVHRVIELKNSKLKEYHGNYTDYLNRRDQEQEMKAINEQKKQPAHGKKTKERRQLEAQARQAISKERNRLQNEIKLLEKQIAESEKAQAEIEEQLSKPETYQDGVLAARLQKDYAAVKQHLQSSYEQWEKVQIELEDVLALK